MRLKIIRKEEDNQVETLLNNDDDLRQSVLYESKFWIFLKQLYAVLSNVVTGVLIAIAILSAAIFVKVRYKGLDVQFAKNLILKSMNNVVFANVAVGWDFPLNRFMVVLNNVIYGAEKIIIPELRLYPNIKELVRLRLKVDKISAISPKVEMDYDGNTMIINNDLVNNFGSKNNRLSSPISINDLVLNLGSLTKHRIDVRDAFILVKNRGFPICEINNVCIENDIDTKVHFSFGQGKNAATILLNIKNDDDRTIVADFSQVHSKYLKNIINIPKQLTDVTLNGKITFTPIIFSDIWEMISLGKFDVTGKNIHAHLGKKSYAIDSLEAKGNFNKDFLHFDSIKLQQDKVNITLDNFEYYKQQELFKLPGNAKIKLSNLSLPKIEKSKNVPFDVHSIHVLDGEFDISGVIPLDSTENNFTSSNYKISFNKCDADLDPLHEIRDAKGSITYKDGRGELKLTSCFMSGNKLGKTKIIIAPFSQVMTTTTTIPADKIFKSPIIKDIPIINQLQNPQGLFSGKVDFYINKHTGTERIRHLDGTISIKDKVLDKYHFSIDNSKILYDNNNLSISGSLRKDNKLQFNIDSSAKKDGTFKVYGELESPGLYALGFPKNILNGTLSIASSGKFNEDFVNIISKIDLKKAEISMPILEKIKPTGTNAIANIETIIRKGQARSTFNIATSQQSIAGSVTTDEHKLMAADAEIFDQEKKSKINILYSVTGKLWDVKCSGTNLNFAYDIHKRIKALKSNGTASFVFVDSYLKHGIKFKKLAGEISILNGNIGDALVKGELGDGRYISIKSQNSDDITATDILSNDAGSFLKLFDISQQISDGSIKMKMFLSPDGRQVKGSANLSNFKMQNKNALRNLINLTSPMGNNFPEEINFNTLVAEFKGKDDQIELLNGQATSPCIWLTFKGTYDKQAEFLRLTGRLFPMHMYISQKQMWISNYLLSGNQSSPTVEASPLEETTKDIILRQFPTQGHEFLFNI